MGQAGGKIKGDFEAFGKKVRNGFDVVGKKMAEGWEHTKSFGKKAWETIKSVPVLGKIAEGIEKYTPIGFAASNIIRGIDTGVGAVSKTFQGDLKGASGAITRGIRDTVNQKIPIVEEIKKVPVLGDAVRFAESKIPVFGGMSIDQIRSVGNAAANSVDALASGDIKNAVSQGVDAFKTFGAARGGAAGNVVKGINVAERAGIL